MGLSFAGPGAPLPRKPRLLLRMRRYLLAAIAACVLTALASASMYLTTGPSWRSYIFQPFSFFLLPGAILDGIPRKFLNLPANTALFLNATIYTLFFARLLRRRA